MFSSPPSPSTSHVQSGYRRRIARHRVSPIAAYQLGQGKTQVVHMYHRQVAVGPVARLLQWLTGDPSRQFDLMLKAQTVIVPW